MSRMRRLYPTYARTIAAHIVRGSKPVAVGVLLSDGFWNRFNHAPKVCIRAEDWAGRGGYEFGYLSGMHAVAIWGEAPRQKFGELLLDLMEAQVALLWAIDLEGQVLWDEHADPYWPVELAGLGMLSTPARLAQETYEKAKRRAEWRRGAMFDIIAKRSGEDAAVKWLGAELQNVERARDLFARPFVDRGEPVAA